MILAVLAAGMGSRYGGLKQIDPMTENGEFIIDFSVYDAIQAGFDKVVFIIKEEIHRDFLETIGKRVSRHIDVEYAFQELQGIPAPFKVPQGRIKPWGTGHAIYSARDKLTENFAVINADDFYGRDGFIKAANHLKKINNPEDCCLVGYRLGNTLSDNGTVTRGVCEADSDNMLKTITETHNIKKVPGGGSFRDSQGNCIHIPNDTLVSMNFWGLTPKVVDIISKDMELFLSGFGDELTTEYCLPTVIDGFMKADKCNVKVYSTDAQWYGVTYAEDKRKVQQSINRLIREGIYPETLWK